MADVKKLESYGAKLGKNIRSASLALRGVPHKQIVASLKEIAKGLKNSEAQILKANEKDLKEARKAGLSLAMIDRLTLTASRLDGIVKSVLEISKLPNPLGTQLSHYIRKDKLEIKRISVPIGAIFFIFESRPNVTIDGAALCLKSGNAVLLRGGKESKYSNEILAKVVRGALVKTGLPENAVQLVGKSDRELVNILLKDDAHFDLVIPRGGERLIEAVVANSKIPVIKHYQGVCHMFIHKTASLEMAKEISVNAKMQRTGVCNAMETLLLDEALPAKTITQILGALEIAGAQLLGDVKSRKIYPNMGKASSKDWETEYLDPRLSVKMVAGVEGAVKHITEYGSGHTDGIVAKDKKVQQYFLDNVDSSSVMVNASTRFADGGEYGLGAEVGISTDKLHARGPMGIESLTTYQWQVVGTGHTR